jgi:hypothetical protein
MKRAAVAGGVFAIISITACGILFAGRSFSTSLLGQAQTERPMSADAVPRSASAGTSAVDPCRHLSLSRKTQRARLGRQHCLQGPQLR